MSWMEALAKTYDNCISEVGINSGTDEHPVVLLPLYHLTVNAAIEITIDENGNFLRADKIDKNSQVTIVPVTENSASRVGEISPMPLVDKLSYIAGDYDEYANDKKIKRPCYEAYMENLYDWANLPGTPNKVKAICKYLEKGTVMSDLKKFELYDGSDVFVRFIVNNTESSEEEKTKTWCDEKIYRSFEQYYSGKIEDFDIDYATGEIASITQKLPGKIRNTGDRAKLISSNDTSGYTFRGRFINASDAAQIGYETSQKAHNALRWLITKQGYRNESEYIVCWAVGGEKTPPVMASTDELKNDVDGFAVDDDDDNDNDTEQIVDTDELFAKRLNKYIAGYKQKINENTRVVVMAVDTADGSGQGRLSITYYNELEGSVLLKNLHKWHSKCAWKHYTKSKDKNDKGNYFYGAPSPREIVLSAYGTEQNGLLKADEKVVKKNIDRILPCIVQGKKFPKDMMYAAVRNAGSPLRFGGFNRNRILTSTCAVIIKCQHDYGKEVFTMALNKESTDRDYLFGRLLAAAHNLEEYVNYKSGNGGRETNAMKFWSVYAQKPARTYQTIRERLQSYISKLSSGSRNYYLELAEEIFDKLSETDSFNNEPLKENYLLGYYSQMEEFRNSKKSVNNEESEED